MGYVAKSGFVNSLIEARSTSIPFWFLYWKTTVQAETTLVSLYIDFDNLDGLGYSFGMENDNAVLSTITFYRDTTPILSLTHAAASQKLQYGILDVSAMTGKHALKITTQMAGINGLHVTEFNTWGVVS